MNENLHISVNGANFIKSFESCVLKAYRDPPRWAIGWGHTIAAGKPEVTPGMVITQDEADKIFLSDMIVYENYVKSFVKVQLNQNQFDALVSACYNMGPGHLKIVINNSNLNYGNYDKIASELLKFNASNGKVLKGLTRRRTAEGALFNRPVGAFSLQTVSASISTKFTTTKNKILERIS